MKTQFWVITGLLLILVVSCKDKYEDCTDAEYAACEITRPQTGRVKLRISITTENPRVPVKIFKGNFEDGDLVFADTARTANLTYVLLTDTEYSVTAEYIRDSRKITAVDGGRIKVSSYQLCELRCYELNEPVFDLRLEE